MFKTATNSSYNYHAVSANDNPANLSGERAHGGVALIWNHTIDNFITPMDTIESDRIVGIKCEFVSCRPLFILAVYLPSASHALEQFKECFDYLWALYDSLSADGFAILLGDFNGDLGNSLGDKGKKGPNDRGLLLLDFANFFKICPINLLRKGVLNRSIPTAGDITRPWITSFCLTVCSTILNLLKHLNWMLTTPQTIYQL